MQRTFTPRKRASSLTILSKRPTAIVMPSDDLSNIDMAFQYCELGNPTYLVAIILITEKLFNVLKFSRGQP
jgi:hypothetical protein